MAQNQGKKRRVLLIAGPTASGKSALALKVSESLDNPLIINADSMQVYSDLRIVTARPSEADHARCDHLLYGALDGSLGYSAAKWRADVMQCLADNPHRAVIFVGGTGLYFRALVEGLSPVPDVPDETRRQVRDRMMQEGSQALHHELDPAMADQLSQTDSQRIARALEVLLATGRSLADWQTEPPEGALVDLKRTSHVVLSPPRNWLEVRIRERVGLMLQDDALEEVRRLRARNLSDERPVMRAIGVSVLCSYLDAEISKDEAVEALTVQTRRYAKRQETWFRGQMADWPRMDPSTMRLDVMADTLLEEDNGCDF